MSTIYRDISNIENKSKKYFFNTLINLILLFITHILCIILLFSINEVSKSCIFKPQNGLASNG